MASAGLIGKLIGDPELRKLAGDVLAKKVRSDLKLLQGGAKLSREFLKHGGRELSAQEQEQLSAIVKDYVRSSLEQVGALIDLSASFADRLTQGFRGSGEPAPPAPDGQPKPDQEMSLAVRKGQTAYVPFRMDNNQAEPLTVTFRSTAFVREDGQQVIQSPIAFDPPRLHLQPRQGDRVTAIIAVRDLFEAGHTYLARIETVGIEHVRFIVRIQVQEQAREQPASEEIAPPAVESKPRRKRGAKAPAPGRATRRAQPKK